MAATYNPQYHIIDTTVCPGPGAEPENSLFAWLEFVIKKFLCREIYVPYMGKKVIGNILPLALILYLIISSHVKDYLHRKEIKALKQRSRDQDLEFAAVMEQVGVSKQWWPDSKMRISQLYIYPIKSIRGCSLPSATLTKDGFSYDRKFMLLRVHDKDSEHGRYQNMHVSRHPEMVLFHTSIQGSTLHVTYHAPDSTESPNEERPTLEIELSPSTLSNLETVEVDMHKSATTAYNMGPKYNEWFTKYFGYEVILAYAGNNRRLVLGNLPGRPATDSPMILSRSKRILQYIPIIRSLVPSQEDGKIAFNDCAPYLVITEASCADVSARLPNGIEMDITKFRANIIITGPSPAFDEDYWGALKFGFAQDKEIILTANCGRCVSLNVDYEKGTSAPKGEGVLKLLMKDRRVDEGIKYSPVFGRYGFLGSRGEGKVLRVGDEVGVSRRNEERTRFYWPGLST